MLLFIRTSQAKPNPNHNNTITHGLNRNVPLMPALYRPHPMGYLVHCWGNVPEHSIVCNAPDSFVYNAI